MSDKIFFSVGPSKLFPTVRKHVDEAFETDALSVSHRGDAYMKVQERAVKGLRTLMNIPDTYEIFFMSSATEAMERAVENCVGKKSGHVIYGAFARRWQKISNDLGRETVDFTVPDGEIPDLSLAQFADDVEMIAFTHNETSTGGMLPFEDVSAFSKRFPNALIGIDIVSSVPYVAVDWSAVDLTLFSVQKGFGLPSGLGVLVVSPRAYQKALELVKTQSIGSYRAFPEMKKYADKFQINETPNMFNMFLLSRVVDDIIALGIDKVRMDTEARAKRLYDVLEAGVHNPFIKDVRGRSQTTITALTPEGSKTVIEALKAKGLVVGSGYGDNKDKHIRIANFTAHTDEDYERLVEAIATL